MRVWSVSFVRVAFFGLLVGSMVCSDVLADGTEELGATAVAPGSGIVVAGVGGEAQPATINLMVPGSSVSQAFLYWNGEGYVAGDDTLEVDNGGGPVAITGDLIGGPTLFYSAAGFGAVYVSTYRANVTSMISIGANTLTISGMDFGFNDNGAGLLVVYDDGTAADVDLRDGQDLAFARFAPPLDATVPQVFNYLMSMSDRTATLDMFFSSVGAGRPNLIRITVEGGAVVELVNQLGSVDGPNWDTMTVAIDIPAGSTSLTVEAISLEDGSGVLPASMAWAAAGLTIGGVPEGEACTPGFWKNRKRLPLWPLDPNDDFDMTFGVDLFDPDITLFKAVWARGGGLGKLARHATAALLAAAHAEVDFPMTVDEIIEAVQAAAADPELLADVAEMFAVINDDLDCPLGSSSR